MTKDQLVTAKIKATLGDWAFRQIIMECDMELMAAKIAELEPKEETSDE